MRRTGGGSGVSPEGGTSPAATFILKEDGKEVDTLLEEVRYVTISRDQKPRLPTLSNMKGCCGEVLW